jgi:hypothetical protein
LLAFICSYEESKYIPVGRSSNIVGGEAQASREEVKTSSVAKVDHEKERSSALVTSGHDDHVRDHIQLKPYRQRLSLMTTTPGGFKEIFRHVFQPFEALFTLPGVAFSAILYGSIASWYGVLFPIMSLYMTEPPYNFSSSGIGLMNIPPFLGGLFGAAYAGPLSDYLILKLAKRRNGVFEPEMRLWLALPGILVGPASILLFGLSLIHVRFTCFPKLAMRTDIHYSTFIGLGQHLAWLYLAAVMPSSLISHSLIPWTATRM